MDIVKASIRTLMNNIHKIVGIFAILVIFELFFRPLRNQNIINNKITELEKSKSGISYKFLKLDFEDYPESRYANVKVIDLDAELEPKEIYGNITCRKSKQIMVSTTLCVHDIKIDVWVSGMIMRDGIFEDGLMSEFNYE